MSSLLTAHNAERLDLIHKTYPAFSPFQYRQVIRFVAFTDRFGLLTRMFDDLHMLGIEPTGAEHHILLLGMARTGRVGKAVKWIEGMEARYGITPTTTDWNVVIDGFRRAKDYVGMKAIVQKMRETGTRPDVVTFNTLISGSFDAGDLDGVRDLLRDMEQEGVYVNVWTGTALLTGFLDAGESASAAESAQRLNSLLETPEGRRDSATHTAAYNALIKFESLDKGYAGALDLVSRLRRKGRNRFECDAWTLNTLAVEAVKDGVETADEGIRITEVIEETVGRAADRRTWTVVSKSLIDGSQNRLDEALRLYQEMRDRSIVPDSAMVHPLL